MMHTLSRTMAVAYLPRVKTLPASIAPRTSAVSMPHPDMITLAGLGFRVTIINLASSTATAKASAQIAPLFQRGLEAEPSPEARKAVKAA